MALRSAKFREVVQQVTAALEDRGISVPEPGVAEIVEERARQVANQASMSVKQVLEHADPQQLAARVAEVIHQGEFAVRPPRDAVPVQIVASRIPALIGGLSEAGKLAASNSDASDVQVALDVVTHLATILHVTIANLGYVDADRTPAEVERGMLIEAAAVMRAASERLSAAEWSTCQCGTEHGQGKVDKALAGALLGRANEIDKLLTVVLRYAIRRSFDGTHRVHESVPRDGHYHHSRQTGPTPHLRHRHPAGGTRKRYKPQRNWRRVVGCARSRRSHMHGEAAFRHRTG